MNTIRVSLTVLIAIIITGCDVNRPTSAVIENGKLLVYHVEERKSADIGKYEYWVRDNSLQGWRFVTDQQFKEGDILQITKAPKP